MRPELTPRQAAIFDHVRAAILTKGYAPTIREIGKAFGIKSTNGVVCHLKALERKGFISRESYLTRAIQLPDDRRRLTMAYRGEIS